MRHEPWCARVQVEQEQGLVFELRTMNRSLQQNTMNLGEDASLGMAHAQPLSLLSEIQQSQVPKLELSSLHQKRPMSLDDKGFKIKIGKYQ